MSRPVVLIALRTEAESSVVSHICLMHGLAPATVKTTRQLYAEARQTVPSLIFVDRRFDKAPAANVCRRLRRNNFRGGILWLGGERGIKKELEQALDAGADAFVPRPFDPDHIACHLVALGRRFGGTFQIGPVTVDEAKLAVWVRGRRMHVQKAQIAVLTYLYKHHGRVVSHEEIIERVLGPGDPSKARVQVKKLRQELAKAGVGHDEVIETIEGAGYRIAPGAKPTKS